MVEVDIGVSSVRRVGCGHATSGCPARGCSLRCYTAVGMRKKIVLTFLLADSLCHIDKCHAYILHCYLDTYGLLASPWRPCRPKVTWNFLFG
jgi:hypothetical protein